MAEIVRWRRAHQPGGSNAGSVFTNPEGDSAGRLVEAAGLKGLRLGRPGCRRSTPTSSRPTRAGSADDVARLDRARPTGWCGDDGGRGALVPEVRLVGFDDGGDGGKPSHLKWRFKIMTRRS